MFCKNCGEEISDVAAVCVKCGVAKGAGNNFCPNCGQPTAPNAVVCTNCGVSLAQPFSPVGAVPGQKSKVVAGLLAIFLGYLGIHNFYLGYTNKGVTQLLISLLLCWTVVAPIAIWIWTIVEAIQIFTGKISDSNGIPLAD